MKCRTLLLALAAGAAATLAPAQEVTTKQTTYHADGSKTVTMFGAPQRTSPADDRDPPAEPQGRRTRSARHHGSRRCPVGWHVTVSTEPASDGSGPAVVTRITTTSVNANGQVKTTTEKTETNAEGDSTKTETTTLSGTVSSYEPGQFITITGPNHRVVKYTITQESELPQEVAVGKTVTVRTYTMNGAPAVRQVTITRTKARVQ
jgi:hypothetical protein